MKCLPLLMLAALFAFSGAASAHTRDCPQRGRCLIAPAPPAPPAPPAVPAPPPMPPPPPEIIVPKAAHDACAGKAIGSKITFSPGKGETMTGSCEKDSKGMYFDLQQYHSAQ